jgi:hypothetical protein
VEKVGRGRGGGESGVGGVESRSGEEGLREGSFDLQGGAKSAEEEEYKMKVKRKV